jgi:hypothetical protein
MTKEQEAFFRILLEAYEKGQKNHDVTEIAFINELKEKLGIVWKETS